MTRYTGPAMDLGNMRSHGVRSIAASCACGHESSVNVDVLPDWFEVPATRQRIMCSACGARPIDVRPDWTEQNAVGRAKTKGE